ncbi:hypothetical protein [Butyrivibrio sp. YAB3001]|uniref:hypothetical protein n=1 Tax=Butyrivibrio sp. YAB3001 TaxID=1520812 RepID=UPI003FA464B0
MLVETCIDRIKADAKPGYKVKMCLMAAKGKEPFYKKFPFLIVLNSAGVIP